MLFTHYGPYKALRREELASMGTPNGARCKLNPQSMVVSEGFLCGVRLELFLAQQLDPAGGPGRTFMAGGELLGGVAVTRR